MFDLELRIIQVQHHLRAPPNSGSGQCSQWDVEGRGCRKSQDLCLQKVSQGRALQQVMRTLHIRQAEEELDSSFQAQPTAKTSSSSPRRRQGGNDAGKWKLPTARTCRRKRLPPKPEVPVQNCFTALQIEEDMSHQEQYWRRVRQSFYFFLLIWMAFISAIRWMLLLQTPALSVVLFQIWNKSGGFLVKKDISAPGIHYKKDST